MQTATEMTTEVQWTDVALNELCPSLSERELRVGYLGSPAKDSYENVVTLLNQGTQVRLVTDQISYDGQEDLSKAKRVRDVLASIQMWTYHTFGRVLPVSDQAGRLISL